MFCLRLKSDVREALLPPKNFVSLSQHHDLPCAQIPHLYIQSHNYIVDLLLLERSAKELREDLRNFPAQIHHLEKESKRKRALLEELGTDYQKSKSLRYFERYKDMKRMIKHTFSASAPPLNHQHQ